MKKIMQVILKDKDLDRFNKSNVEEQMRNMLTHCLHEYSGESIDKINKIKNSESEVTLTLRVSIDYNEEGE